MIVIAGSVAVKPETRAEAVEALLKMGAASRAEDGCNTYQFAADLADPNVIVVLEVWESAEILERHFATPHMAEFTGKLGQYVAGDMNVVRYEISSSGPLF
ncbi:MAG: antibiotic biosynthesis monooxygenase [Actinomycetota bacterium]|nr:antibiotic biosynthesis monooxygenase [Acidimicrobiia bacterium]MDQ3147122.1 antibiotic biosynthesis monooxygenase [Actinomycetota bacterium]